MRSEGAHGKGAVTQQFTDAPFASIKALNAAVIERLTPVLAPHGFKPTSKTEPLFKRKTAFGWQSLRIGRWGPHLPAVTLVPGAAVTHDVVERILGMASNLDRKSLKHQATTLFAIDVPGFEVSSATVGSPMALDAWTAAFLPRFEATLYVYARDSDLAVVEAIVNKPSFDGRAVSLAGPADAQSARAMILAKLVGRDDLAAVAALQRTRLAALGIAHVNEYPNVNVSVPVEALVLSIETDELIARAMAW
jgi:hypothetical protein